MAKLSRHIIGVTLAELEGKSEKMTVAVAMRVAEIIIIHQEMTMFEAMSAHRKIVEAKIRLTLESLKNKQSLPTSQRIRTMETMW